MISVVDVDAEIVATEIIVAVNGDIPISGSPSPLPGKGGELGLVVWCEDVDIRRYMPTCTGVKIKWGVFRVGIAWI